MMGPYLQSKNYAKNKKLIPVWCYWDDIIVEGAEIINGNFEKETDKGEPKGWNGKKENFIKNFVNCVLVVFPKNSLHQIFSARG